MKKLDKIGVQLWTVRDFMNTAEDIRETFKRLKSLGYDQVQTAGCNIPYEEFGKIARDEKIEIIGTHESFDEMYNDFESALKKHEALGTYNMGIGGLFRNDGDVSEFMNNIKKMNEIGEKLRKYGARFSYHNHDYEFVTLSGGKYYMDLLEENLNPETTSFNLDMYWVQQGGGDIRLWLDRLAGRIDIIHLKDMLVTFNPKTWERDHHFAEIGSGNFDWDSLIEQMIMSKVKYYIVEQDICPEDPFKCLERSSNFLHKNFM